MAKLNDVMRAALEVARVYDEVSAQSFQWGDGYRIIRLNTLQALEKKGLIRQTRTEIRIHSEYGRWEKPFFVVTDKGRTLKLAT